MHTPSKGFTLVEVMVTVVIAGILAVVALPSLSSWYDRARADSEIRKIQDTLKFARNQAFSYGATVGVCPAGASGCGTDWKQGIRVFLVRPDNTQETLKVINAFNAKDSIKGLNVTFTPNGLASQAITFTYCPKGESTYSKSIELSVTGLIKTASDGQSCS